MTRVPDPTPLIGAQVTRLCLDYSVTLLLGADDEEGEQRIDATMVIGAPFTVTADGSSTTVVPDTGENLAAVLSLLRSTVKAVTVASDQTLTLTFDSGLSVTVPRDPQYESWELLGDGVDGCLAGPP